MYEAPGVMIYFDMIPTIEKLTDQEKGQLLLAILYYAQLGVIPDLTGVRLEILWPLMQSKIQRDKERYDQIVLKRRYAAYTRWAKQNAQTPMSYNEWCYSKSDVDASAYDAMQELPTQL